MNTTTKNKTCSSCDAELSIAATYCPFCGSDVLGPAKKAKSEGDSIFSDHSVQESLASLYKPPYSSRNRFGLGVPDERDEGDYSKSETQGASDALFQEYNEETLGKQETLVSKQGGFLSLLLLTVGAQLFILGLLLALFSSDGKLTLQWSSHLWYWYLLIAAPMLFLGFRQIKKIPDSTLD
ncbi:MAG: hypothetical protein KAR79_04735 [Simkaniaceae bacterium]|nr:hypothetical protein [Simkaniaceae bacterium]